MYDPMNDSDLQKDLDAFDRNPAQEMAGCQKNAMQRASS